MARTPVRIQGGTFGTDNPASFTPSYGNRSQSQPTILQRGPSQGREQFSASSLADSSSVARALNQLQSNVHEAIGPSKSNPFADGNLIERFSFANGTNVIHHGLGAPARGYIITNTNGTIMTSKVAQDPADLENQTIAIFSTGAFTGDIWVYR